MKAVLERLVERHGTYGVDWMGFTLSKKNPLTYHHIIKECEKGKKTVENGAPLTKQAHAFLNCLERVKPDLYEEWNELGQCFHLCQDKSFYINDMPSGNPGNARLIKHAAIDIPKEPTLF